MIFLSFCPSLFSSAASTQLSPPLPRNKKSCPARGSCRQLHEYGFLRYFMKPLKAEIGFYVFQAFPDGFRHGGFFLLRIVGAGIQNLSRRVRHMNCGSRPGIRRNHDSPVPTSGRKTCSGPLRKPCPWEAWAFDEVPASSGAFAPRRESGSSGR